jgi:hypothetical protein
MKSVVIYLGIVLTLSLMLAWGEAKAATYSFTDVDANSVFAPAVAYLKNNNIVQGYADGTFKPSLDISRSEFLKIVLEANKIPTSSMVESQCFFDIYKGMWYTKYVCYAKTKEYTSGYADSTFRPLNSVTLAEALKMIFKANGIAVTTNTTAWYQPYMDKAKAKSMLVNIGKAWNNQITREEMAELIYKLKK